MNTGAAMSKTGSFSETDDVIVGSGGVVLALVDAVIVDAVVFWVLIGEVVVELSSSLNEDMDKLNGSTVVVDVNG